MLARLFPNNRRHTFQYCPKTIYQHDPDQHSSTDLTADTVPTTLVCLKQLLSELKAVCNNLSSLSHCSTTVCFHTVSVMLQHMHSLIQTSATFYRHSVTSTLQPVFTSSLERYNLFSLRHWNATTCLHSVTGTLQPIFTPSLEPCLHSVTRVCPNSVTGTLQFVDSNHPRVEYNGETFYCQKHCAQQG